MKHPERIFLRPVRAIFKKLESGDISLRQIQDAAPYVAVPVIWSDRTGKQLKNELGKLPRPELERLARLLA